MVTSIGYRTVALLVFASRSFNVRGDRLIDPPIMPSLAISRLNAEHGFTGPVISIAI